MTSDYITIQLTRGQTTIIDVESAYLAEYRWYANKLTNGFYVVRSIREEDKIRKEYLHRVILSLVLGRNLDNKEHVDHINGDPLDNRSCNLRLATKSQNRMNSAKNKNSISDYKGISWNKHARKWEARIQSDGKSYYLGCFDNPYEAHLAYCKKAKELHGEFANFG